MNKIATIGHNQPDISVEGLSADDKKSLKKSIMELNDSMTRVAAERDLQKEIITEAFDKLGVDKKLVRKMAKSYFLSNFKDEVSWNNRFEEFYDAVVHQTVA